MATAARKGGQEDVLETVTMAMGARGVGVKREDYKERKKPVRFFTPGVCCHIPLLDIMFPICKIIKHVKSASTVGLREVYLNFSGKYRV